MAFARDGKVAGGLPLVRGGIEDLRAIQRAAAVVAASHQHPAIGQRYAGRTGARVSHRGAGYERAVCTVDIHCRNGT